MADFNVRSDSVNVEQIMEQIRSRIREKRGVDYTEAEIRELAGVRLEQFIDPDKLRSIFDPFVQVDSSHTRTTDGAGLGLPSAEISRAAWAAISPSRVSLARDRPSRSR